MKNNYRLMFRELITILNCCRKRKSSEETISESGDIETGKNKKNSKNNRKPSAKDEIIEKIDIDGNFESEHLIRETNT